LRGSEELAGSRVSHDGRFLAAGPLDEKTRCSMTLRRKNGQSFAWPHDIKFRIPGSTDGAGPHQPSRRQDGARAPL